MSQKTKIRVFLGFAIACWVVIALWAMITHQQGSAVNPIYDTVHGDIYGGSGSFSVYQEDVAISLNEVSAAVLQNPHKNPKALGESMAILGEHLGKKPLLIVVFEEGIGNTPLTGDWGWQTPYGVVPTKKELVDTLKKNGVKEDNKKIGTSEDLGAVIYSCSFYLQGAPIVPLVLDESMGEAEMRKILEDIQEDIGSDAVTLVVTPPVDKEEVLYHQELSSYEKLLAEVRTTDFSGIFQDEENLALLAFSLLLPKDDHGIVTYGISGKTTVEKFSDLMIFCEK